jgi:signal transduction histidine kinase
MTIEGALRVQSIVQDLQRFSRSDPDEALALVDVRHVLAFTVDMTRPIIGEHARIVRDFGPVPTVLASEGRLNQVFLNLILNAAQAIAERAQEPEIRITTSTDERGRAVVAVSDNGVGIAEAHIRKIFDPFFTTKPSGVGTGLGLAICRGITTSFGGEITVESTVGVGSVFRMILPAAYSGAHSP